MCPPGYKLTAWEERQDFILGARSKREVMQNTVCIFSLKNGSVTVCTCTESRSCAGPGPQPGQQGRGPQPRARRACSSQKLPPLRGYGWKCHCRPLGTHQPHHKPSLQELRLAPAKGAAVDRGVSSSSGQHLALLLLHSSQQPKMKEKTIPVPSTDGGRAPNDAVNVPSEEVSPNPQQICPVSPGVAISLLHLSVEPGSILKAPSCPVCWFHSRSGALGSAPGAAASWCASLRWPFQ